MMAIDDAPINGASLAASCAMIELGVRTVQRWRKDRDAEYMRLGPKTTPMNKLCNRERKSVLAIMNQPEFRDLPPSQIVPRLADMGRYVASESTMYRVLKEHGQSVHRGRKKQPSKVSKPTEKLATAPGQLYSWDITYLRSPIRGEYFYLYMVLDVWTRKIVGHVVHEAESSEQRLGGSLYRGNISPRGLARGAYPASRQRFANDWCNPTCDVARAADSAQLGVSPRRRHSGARAVGDLREKLAVPLVLSIERVKHALFSSL